MSPELFENRNTCIYISKAKFCLFSGNTFWSNLWSKRKRPDTMQTAKCGSFQQKVLWSQVAAWLVVPISRTSCTSHTFQTSSFSSHICSVASGKMAMRSNYTRSISCFILQPYCEMFASVGSYLSNCPLQKKQTHVVNIACCPAPPVWTEELHQQVLEHM